MIYDLELVTYPIYEAKGRKRIYKGQFSFTIGSLNPNWKRGNDYAKISESDANAASKNIALIAAKASDNSGGGIGGGRLVPS